MSLFRRKGATGAKTMPAFAEKLGLEYAEQPEPADLRAAGPMPDLPLLREGDETSISRLMYGELDAEHIRIFDYTSRIHVSEDTNVVRTCVLLTADGAALPELFISPRDRLPRLGETLREGGIAVGSPALMRKYSIQARAREHASDLIGSDLESWLTECTVPDLRVEVRGGSILGHTPAVHNIDELIELLEFVRGFHHRIPGRAWNLYRSL